MAETPMDANATIPRPESKGRDDAEVQKCSRKKNKSANHKRKKGSDAPYGQLFPGLGVVAADDRLRHLISLLGVDDPICTLRKKLTATDVAKNQGRLQVSYEQARDLLECAAVTDGEKALMASPRQKLAVAAYDRMGNEYAMRFAKVETIEGKAGMYRLTRSYRCFLERNKLHEGHTVVVRVFRLPRPPVIMEEELGTLAMLLLSYESEDYKEQEAKDEEALRVGVAAGALLLLCAARPASN